MATNRYLKLDIMTTGTDKARNQINLVRKDADELTSRPRNVRIGVDDKEGQAKLENLKLKLDILGRKVTTAKTEVDDSKSKAKLIDLELKLHRMNDYVASPKITLNGADRTLARIYQLDAALDRLSHKSARIDIEGKRGLFSRIGGLFGGGSSLGGIGSKLGSIGSSVGSAAGPVAMTAGIGLAASLLPALTPAVIGAGTALGGVFAAAMINKGFRSKVTTLLGSLENILGFVVKPVQSAFAGMIPQIDKFATSMEGPLRQAFKASVPFLKQFIVVLEQSAKILLPAFTQAMHELVKTGAMRQMTQGLVLIVKGLAGFLQALGPGMKSSATIFKAAAEVVNVLLKGIGYAATGLAVGIVQLAQTAKVVAHDIRNSFDVMRHDVANNFDGLRHDVAHIWDTTWNNTIGRLARGVDDANHLINGFGHDIAHAFDNLRHSVSSTWDTMWNDVKNFTRGAVHGVASVIHGIESAFRSPVAWVVDNVWDRLAGIWNKITGIVHLSSLKLPVVHMATGGKVPGHGSGDIVPAMLEPGERVLSRKQVAAAGGHGVLDALFGRGTGGPFAFSGGGIIGGIGSWLSGIGKDLLSWVTKPLSFITSHLFGGVESMLGHIPGGGAMAEVMKSLTMSLIDNLGKQAKQGAQAFSSSKYTGHYGAGVKQWTGDVLRVLAMLHQPAGDLGVVLSQMMTESGGNPNAINLWDSNAKAGDPSRGLMQVIGSTFAAYRSRLFPDNIYNPLANIFAGLNYAIHRYGGGWTSVLGHGHGYANGGLITEPIIGMGLRSGDHYSFGEIGPETVIPGRHAVGDGGNIYITVTGDFANPDATALRIVQAIRDMKRHKGNQPLGIG